VKRTVTPSPTLAQRPQHLSVGLAEGAPQRPYGGPSARTAEAPGSWHGAHIERWRRAARPTWKAGNTGSRSALRSSTVILLPISVRGPECQQHHYPERIGIPRRLEPVSVERLTKPVREPLRVLLLSRPSSAEARHRGRKTRVPAEVLPTRTRRPIFLPSARRGCEGLRMNAIPG
jgi:hypothetical protein